MTLIASILHRETIAALVGERTFERGDRCYRARRVLGVRAAPGQLLGIVQPSEAGRARYEVRVWIKEDGLAYSCTCPVGVEGRFCKHAVAIALAHMDTIQRETEAQRATLERRLLEMTHAQLVAKLVAAAREDDHVRALLEAII